MRVRRMPLHLSSGHVTFVPRKFYPPLNFPKSDLGRRADLDWALPQNFSFFVQRRKDCSRQRLLDFVAIFIVSRDICGQTRKLS